MTATIISLDFLETEKPALLLAEVGDLNLAGA